MRSLPRSRVTLAAVSALPRIVGTRLGRDVAPALLLTAAGLLEVLAGPGGDGSRLVSAVAVAGTTLPLAWRRTVPLLPPVVIAIVLIVQALLGGWLVGEAATPLVALVIALYSAGRHVEGDAGLAVAALCVVVTSVTRVVADPAAQSPGQAGLTLVAVSLPLLVGRWVRGQALLQRGFVERAEQLERDRERDAQEAAEEERMRIAGDLEAAIAGRLQEIVHGADALPRASGPATTPRRARCWRASPRAPATRSPTCAGCSASCAGTARRRPSRPRRRSRPVPPAWRGSPARAPPPRAGSRRRGSASGARPAARRRPVRGRGARARVHRRDRRPAGAIATDGADRRAAAVAPAPARSSPPPPCSPPIALQSTLLDLDAFPVFDIAAVVCATYAIGAYAERRTALAGLAFAVAGVGVHAAVFYPEGVVAALLGGVAAPWTIGRVVRGHRQLTRAGRDEAARVEHVRAREARAAVTAERMRVARELHDAVAHNISVIAIQAGGADGIVERDPARAAQSPR